MPKLIRYGAGVLAIGLWSYGCLMTGCLVGSYMTEGAAKHDQYLEERNAVAPLLASDPAFGRVTTEEQSRGGIILEGEVPTSEDLRRLHQGLTDVFGKRRADDMILPVAVKGDAGDGS